MSLSLFPTCEAVIIECYEDGERGGERGRENKALVSSVSVNGMVECHPFPLVICIACLWTSPIWCSLCFPCIGDRSLWAVSPGGEDMHLVDG